MDSGALERHKINAHEKNLPEIRKNIKILETNKIQTQIKMQIKMDLLNLCFDVIRCSQCDYITHFR